MRKNIKVKSFKLPMLFDVDMLQADLHHIEKFTWNDHHYTMNYEGNWTVLSLLSETGNESDISSIQSQSQKIKPTPILARCHYLKAVLDQFEFPIITARLLKLTAGSVIKPHQDYRLGYENNNFRLHIPITTNEEVNFILDGNQIIMKPGECWYTNVNFTHSVSNLGTTDRIHLVIDGERNDWSDEIFFSFAPMEDFGIDKEEFDEEEAKLIIVQLKTHNSETAKEMILQLKHKMSKT